MNIRLIDYFGIAPKNMEPGQTPVDPTVVNMIAVQLGYIIHPACCSNITYDWVKKQSVNYNSTFYKTWDDVTSRSRQEIFIDQIIHYAFSYGADMRVICNDEDYTAVPDITSYKVILPASIEEIGMKAVGMLEAGIALNSNTCDDLVRFLVNYKLKHLIDIDKIKNREAQIRLCDMFGIAPTDATMLIHYIYYKVTGESMIVKHKNCIHNIAFAGTIFNMSQLSEEQLKSLSTVFYRFKPIFLGLKKQKRYINHQIDYPNKNVINRIRRMAVVYHKPMKKGFWETVLNTPLTYREIYERLRKDNPSNFKLIRLIQAIRENRMMVAGMGPNMYPIRNGKVWFKKSDHPAMDIRYEWWDALETILYRELVDRLKDKACVVRFPKGLELACPTSEKTFIGNIPWGSSYNMAENSIVGIYWRNEWGARDFDLSFVSFTGNKIGWNASYNTGDIIYSGDMTNADPEAAECILLKRNCPNGVFKVNLYNGNPNSRFKMMVAQSNTKELPKNYMVDPNDIKVQTEVVSNGENLIGYVIDNNLCICNFQIGSSHVSRYNTLTDVESVYRRKANSFLMLKQLLLDAGFKERKRPNPGEEVLDLTDLKKDTLIELFK